MATIPSLHRRGYIDNFSSFEIEWRCSVYLSAEHAYQSAKFETKYGTLMMHVEDPEPIADMIRKAPSAIEARRLGNSFRYKPYIREDWDDARVQIMKELLLILSEENANSIWSGKK